MQESRRSTKSRFTRVKVSAYATPAIKLWVNAVPWRCDTYRSCDGECTYCFARGMEKGSIARMGIIYRPNIVRVGDIPRLAKRYSKIFDKGEVDIHDFVDWCIARRWMVEWGTMGEPFQNVELKLGYSKYFMGINRQYGIPTFCCTKGFLLCHNEELYDQFVELKKVGLIADISLISLNDERLKRLEPNVPSATERVALIKRLCDDGVNVTVSLRPFIRGLSDIHVEEYIRKLADVGVKTIHLRNFYVIPSLTKAWKGWTDANKDMLHRKGWTWVYKRAYLEMVFEEFSKIAEPLGVDIVGAGFVGLGKSHKIDFTKLDEKVKKGTFPYTILPIYQKIQNNPNSPILFRYEKDLLPLLSNGDIFLEQMMKINQTSFILTGSCSCVMKPRVITYMKMRDIISKTLWDGWVHSPESVVGHYHKVYPIRENGGRVFDENGHKIWIYLPEKPSSPVTPKMLRETYGIDIGTYESRPEKVVVDVDNIGDYFKVIG